MILVLDVAGQMKISIEFFITGSAAHSLKNSAHVQCTWRAVFTWRAGQQIKLA